MTTAVLASRALGLCAAGRRAVLGITGAPGAGKSTLAQHLVTAVEALSPASPGRVAYVPMDGFHLADRQLDRLGLRHRKGAPETFDPLGYAALLRRLREDRDHVVYAPAFDREIEAPVAGAVAVGPEVDLVVTEGNYLLLDRPPWAAVAPLLDETWFVELDDDERVHRLVARHEAFGKSHDAAVAWVRDSDEPNAELVRGTRDKADLVIAWDP
jgi:pantothenate kinase